MPKPGTRPVVRPQKREPLGINSVEIALGVLQAMVRQGGPASLGSLSRATELKPSKLHRYLVSLARCGMAAQSPITSLYDLGPAARQLGAAAFNRFDGVGLAQECIIKLANQTGYSVLLYIWTEQGATLIRTQNGLRPPAMILRIGSSLPLRSSGIGQVFLAYLPENLTKPLVLQQLADSEDIDEPDAGTPIRLASIRRDGLFWTSRPILPGADLLAVPVFEAQHQVHSVIGIAVPRQAVTPEIKQKLISQALAATKALSAELGDAAAISGGDAP
jgi:DNA-binding IclR family transcriptional regulator